jgi:hypothetical protein
MTIELGQYGFMLDTEWCYVALSWQLIIVSAIALIGYKIYKKFMSREPKSFELPLQREDKSFWIDNE